MEKLFAKFKLDHSFGEDGFILVKTINGLSYLGF
ncbi:hypothetical protein Cflav_PD6449 [Pedosphaera parvula Ellin514]|uniref:Uncharacterized protein n=1 Tax=Pedosphaera parvula (strain Ellin514) TaxID=320771 RepID=B9XDM8_PEDPL|nr:hypothetical protein Cflav_PD6449 [Pedosphaera parvula Ellin514]